MARDPETRRESFIAISRYPDEGVDRLLLDRLSDPDSEIRATALDTIVRRGKKELGETALKRMLGTSALAEQSLNEKRRFFAAAAKLCGDSVLAELQGQLTGKEERWFTSRKDKELAEAVAHGIRMIGTDDALGFLAAARGRWSTVRQGGVRQGSSANERRGREPSAGVLGDGQPSVFGSIARRAATRSPFSSETRISMDLGNQVFEEPLEKLEHVLERLLHAEGRFRLERGGEELFANGVRLRMEIRTLHAYKYVFGELQKRDVGGIAFETKPDVAALSGLLEVLAAHRASDADDAAAPDTLGVLQPRAHRARHHRDQAPRRARGDPRSRRRRACPPDRRERAVNAYQQALDFIRDSMLHVDSPAHVNLRKAKRTVQKLVDLSYEEGGGFSLAGMASIKQHDDYTFNHMVNVCVLAIAFGQRLGLRRQDIAQLGLCALYHDMGKLHIPLDVLNNHTGLSEKEWAVMGNHTVFAARTLFPLIEVDRSTVNRILTALQHHLRYGRHRLPPPPDPDDPESLRPHHCHRRHLRRDDDEAHLPAPVPARRSDRAHAPLCRRALRPAPRESVRELYGDLPHRIDGGAVRRASSPSSSSPTLTPDRIHQPQVSHRDQQRAANRARDPRRPVPPRPPRPLHPPLRRPGEVRHQQLALCHLRRNSQQSRPRRRTRRPILWIGGRGLPRGSAGTQLVSLGHPLHWEPPSKKAARTVATLQPVMVVIESDRITGTLKEFVFTLAELRHHDRHGGCSKCAARTHVNRSPASTAPFSKARA